MAKEDKAEVEMTVIHFKTKSDNATLQENIRAIANTLTRALAPPPIQPRIVNPPAPAQLHSGNGASNGTEQAPQLDGYDDAIEVDAIPAAPKKAKSSAAPKYAAPKALDLDLTSGDMPLKSFIEQKKPDGDIKRYLAIAYWFKEYRATNEITKDHAYTCYRFMGWSDVPKDVSGPFRAMKKKEYGWMNAGSVKGKGLYAINHIGENVVNQMGNE